MEIIYLKDKKQLDSFLETYSSVSSGGAEFLQSFDWGEIGIKRGEEILRLAVIDEAKKIVCAITLIKKEIAFGFYYLYAPRGPVYNYKLLDNKSSDLYRKIRNFLFSEINKIYCSALFLRFEEGAEIYAFENKTRKTDKKKIKKTIDLQPKKTLILDLDKSEEELLKEMHQKTRYNIRLAEKKGVKIIEGLVDFETELSRKSSLSELWRLLNITGERDGFRLHALSHYRSLLEAERETVRIYFASYKNKNIAVVLTYSFGDKVTYLHGASDNEFRSVMAPYLLQFEIIKKAKAAGYKYYDFFGIDEKKWPGVTRFKLGFGGRSLEYSGTKDFIFRPLSYWFYEIFRKLRRLI